MKIISANIAYCCLLCLTALVSTAQHDSQRLAYPDSLLQLTKSVASDSTRIELFFELSNYWSDRDTLMAFRYVREAGRYFSKDNNYYKGLTEFYTGGIIYNRDIPRAKNHYLLAEFFLKEYESPLAYRYRARLWNNYGTLLQYQNDDDSFMTIIINKAIPFARQAGDSILLAHNLHNIGLLLMNVREYAKADQYYKQAIRSLAHYSAANEDKLTVFVNASKNAIYSERYPDARTYLDSAGFQIAAVPHSTFAPAYYRAEGNYYRHVNNKEKALENFNAGLPLAAKTKDNISLYDLHFGRYAVYKQFGEYRLAKNALVTAMQYLNKTPLAQNRLVSMSEMADIEYKLGNFKNAVDWTRRYLQLKDSTYEENLKLRILELDEKFKDAEKRNEILQLRHRSQTQELVIAQNRWWIIALAAGLLVAIILLYFLWKLDQQKKRAIAQKEQLHNEQLKALRQEQTLKLYDSMLTGEERERTRLSRDLHDGLGSMLSSVKWKLSSLEAGDGSLNANLAAITSSLDGSIEELRRVSRNMLPASLVYMGLEPALRDLCNSLDSQSLPIRFQSIGLRSNYDQHTATAAYRMVQELLTNALRHASATSVIIQCAENHDRLCITVEDNGTGIAVNVEEDMAPGIGLANIRNRVELLKGTVEIETGPSTGTTVYIELPLS